MKRLYSGMLLSMLTLPVFARSDGALTSAFVKQSPRASSVAYRAFGAASAHKTSSATQSANTSIQKTDSVTQQADSAISETVNAEKEACLANNLATGNTFVYASINSNTSNYASMVEDVVNPGNNACYVRVNLTSSDSSVDLSDMPVRYFKMDKTVTCGQWVEEATLQER
ncbi:MAG: hypothetical protein IKZ34_01435, partial [Alphaproteobacteria bacterium]|nr:hypothetical protein [Alphaproteobacteria bacterium]